MARRGYVLLALLIVGCGRTPPPTPSPGPGSGDIITGRERLGWDQPAASAAELATFRYAVYVDGARSEIADANCGTTAGAGGFDCSGRLPAMSNGSHTLELAAFFDAGGVVESPKSPPLRITVAAAAAPASVVTLQSGDIVTTRDGAKLEATLVATGLNDVVDIAVLPDARLIVAERAGAVRLVTGVAVTHALRAGPGTGANDGGILAVTVDSDVARTGHVFITHTPAGVFRVVRYRIAGGALVDRTALIRDVPASADPSAALRVGPDRKLYAAFDDGGSRDAAARLSEWNGKILRLNEDGGTPDDQPSASPVFWSGLGAPRGLAWTADTGTLWLAELGREGMERVTALATGPERPRRAAQRASHALPQPLGARSLAFYRGDDIREFRGDMFIAGSEAGYVLRVRFDPANPLRALASERLLDGRIGAVRAVAASPDGALYVAGDSTIWRLGRARD